jgi:hypothetical protein
MKPFLPAAALVAALVSADARTDYTAKRALVMVAHTSLEMESTTRMEVDGQPVDRAGGGSGSLEERTVEQTYKVLAHAEDAPTKVRRAFGTVTRKTTTNMGEQSFDGGGDGPLNDVTLEITLDEDGDVIAAVVDGSEPDQESALQGHELTLAFDGLLPLGDVAADAKWDLESPAILRALGLDLEDAYFPVEPPDEDGGDSGGRGRGRAFRGARSSALRGLTGCTWEGEATFKGETEHDGIACLEFLVELEASGEMPEQAGFGGPPRGGRAFGAALGGLAPDENSIAAKLEGRLLFAKAARYPVLFEVEGSVTTVRHVEMERGGSKRMMHTEGSGTLEYRVEVAVETDDE